MPAARFPSVRRAAWCALAAAVCLGIGAGVPIMPRTAANSTGAVPGPTTERASDLAGLEAGGSPRPSSVTGPVHAPVVMATELSGRSEEGASHGGQMLEPDAGVLNEDVARDEATDAADTYIALADELLAQPGAEERSDVDRRLKIAAEGSALGEMEAVAADYAEQSLTQVGGTRILGTEVLELDLEAKHPTMTVSVCVDASGVDVLDSAGQSLADFLFRPGHPVRENYELTHDGTRWRVSARQFTEEVIACTA